MVAFFKAHCQKAIRQIVNPFVKIGVAKTQITIRVHKKITVRLLFRSFPQNLA
jgi:hypothetical protein